MSRFFTVASSSSRVGEVVVQAWHATGEACPEGTVAIRRKTEKDLLRASSLKRYGRKPARRSIRRDSSSSGHEDGLHTVSTLPIEKDERNNRFKQRVIIKQRSQMIPKKYAFT